MHVGTAEAGSPASLVLEDRGRLADVGRGWGAQRMIHEQPTRFTVPEALERLRAGNARFVRGEMHFPTVQNEVLAALAKQQRPYAPVLGCSDSRVPPELLFDVGL